GAQRVRWSRLAARHAEYAGWLAQESGDAQAAVWWTDTAVRMAGRDEDAEMTANALVRRAVIALYQDDAYETIQLGQNAQQVSGSGPRVRGLAALHEAQGHALAGEDAFCEQALDRGAKLLLAAQNDMPELALGSVSTPDFAAAVRGWCYYDLGRPAQ